MTGSGAVIGRAGTPTVHLATEPVDMRKSINGLSVLVADQLGLNPLNSSS